MEKAVNEFTSGLIMDYNPLTLQNTSLTDCLNGTLVTLNGNERILQNDMGNARVETAYLPVGYVPIGTTELGGIIYIVSYNPFLKKCQIGSFPSPERNFTTDEIGENQELNLSAFFTKEITNIRSKDNELKTPILKLKLLDEIKSGDKYSVFSLNIGSCANYISGISSGKDNLDIHANPKYLKLLLVSIANDGTVSYIDDLIWNEISNEKYYYILNKEIKLVNEKSNLEEYTDLINSNYNVFNNSNKAQLGIVASVECVDSFSVSWDSLVDENGKIQLYWYLNWTYDNPNEISKNLVNPSGIFINTKAPLKKVTIGDDLYKYYIGEFTISDIKVQKFDKLSEIGDVSLVPISYPTTSANEIVLTTPDTYKNNFSEKKFIAPKDPYKVFSTDGSIDIKSYLKSLDKEGEESYYKVAFDSSLYRLNNGEDIPFLVKMPIQFEKESTGIYTFDITPCMPFGKLNWLTLKISINFSNLNSDITNLKIWKYYIGNNDITLNWGLECYSNGNQRVNSVKFDYIEFGNYKADHIPDYSYLNSDNSWITTDVLSKQKLNKLIEIDNKVSFAGSFQEKKSFDDKFQPNKTYIVRITIDYDGTPRYYYRLLFTHGMFNTKFYSNINDFGTIELGEVLKPTASMNAVDESGSSWAISYKGTTNEKIPSYLLENGIYDYMKCFKKNINISTDASINSGYNDIVLSLPEGQNFTHNLKVSCNTQSTYQNTDLQISDIEYPKELSNGLDVTIKVPFKVQYSKSEPIPNLYIKKPLNSDNKEVRFEGGEQSANIMIEGLHWEVGNNLEDRKILNETPFASTLRNQLTNWKLDMFTTTCTKGTVNAVNQLFTYSNGSGKQSFTTGSDNIYDTLHMCIIKDGTGAVYPVIFSNEKSNINIKNILTDVYKYIKSDKDYLFFTASEINYYKEPLIKLNIEGIYNDELNLTINNCLITDSGNIPKNLKINNTEVKAFDSITYSFSTYSDFININSSVSDRVFLGILNNSIDKIDSLNTETDTSCVEYFYKVVEEQNKQVEKRIEGISYTEYSGKENILSMKKDLHSQTLRIHVDKGLPGGDLLVWDAEDLKLCIIYAIINDPDTDLRLKYFE